MKIASIEYPVLESSRLLLRGWTEDDHKVLRDIWSGEQNSRFIGGPMTDEVAWRHLGTIMGHWQMRGFGAFCIEEKSSGEGIGWVGPWRPYGWPENEILYSLVPNAHGKGYASEAAALALDFAYNTLGWETAVSYIDAENTASQKVAKRLGARHDGDTDLNGEYFMQIWRHLSPAEFSNRAA